MRLSTSCLSGTCLLLALYGSSFQAAHAQIIAGNLPNRTSDTNFSSAGAGLNTSGKLIGFTMGSVSLGLQDVQLQLAIPGGTAGTTLPLITIWQATSSTNPAILSSETVPLLTLTNPTASNSGSTTTSTSLAYTFTAGTAFTLQANTSYDIVAQETSGTGAISWELGSNQTNVGTGATQIATGLFTTGGQPSPKSWASSSGNINWYQVDQVAAVPEPSTWCLLGLGGLLLILRSRFKTA